MRSTFMGLETNKRGLFTQQSALYTTGHNVSNANTDGYSRQRVNMSPTLGYPGTGLNAPKTAGYIGTGVQAESVQRIRDEFIDRQFRQESNKLGYWESRADAISQMEDIMSEPSEYGIDEAFRLFWSSLQDVSTSPEDIAARKVAIQRAEHLTDSFNYINTQLRQIQGNLGNEIDVSTSQVNSILKQIADINRQIQEVEPNGYLPNDLYDARDTLIDELNEYLPVSIERVPSGGNALEIAEGSYTVKYKTASGTDIILVQGKEHVELTAKGVAIGDTAYNNVTGDEPLNFFTHFEFNQTINPDGTVTTPAAATLSYNELISTRGKLVSLIDSYGYVTNPIPASGLATSDVLGYYPDMNVNLNKLEQTLAEVFNTVHKAGYPLPPNTPSTDDFFVIDSNGFMSVNPTFINNPSLLAASSANDEEGNGKWAIELANLQSLSIDSSAIQIDLDLSNPTDANVNFTPTNSLDGATFQSFYKGIIGQLGVDGQEAEQLRYNTETIRLTVENNRAAMSSVSLDEEMTNMIKFQQAYNANARMITVIDETLDKIINGMGRVGL